MRKYKYFELDELIKSDVAKAKGIDNTPTFEVVEHLGELVERLLDPLRDSWGKAIKVNSGYRCEKLNKAVGGAPSSAHMLGYAADLQVSTSFAKFRDFVTDWFTRTGVRFDQVLVETNKQTGAKWIHVALYDGKGQQRRQIRILSV